VCRCNWLGYSSPSASAAASQPSKGQVARYTLPVVGWAAAASGRRRRRGCRQPDCLAGRLLVILQGNVARNITFDGPCPAARPSTRGRKKRTAGWGHAASRHPFKYLKSLLDGC
jgi:hypothetical protein